MHSIWSLNGCDTGVRTETVFPARRGPPPLHVGESAAAARGEAGGRYQRRRGRPPSRPLGALRGGDFVLYAFMICYLNSIYLHHADTVVSHAKSGLSVMIRSIGITFFNCSILASLLPVCSLFF
jgi:hypothetical protein